MPTDIKLHRYHGGVTINIHQIPQPKAGTRNIRMRGGWASEIGPLLLIGRWNGLGVDVILRYGFCCAVPFVGLHVCLA